MSIGIALQAAEDGHQSLFVHLSPSSCYGFFPPRSPRRRVALKDEERKEGNFHNCCVTSANAPLVIHCLVAQTLSQQALALPSN